MHASAVYCGTKNCFHFTNRMYAILYKDHVVLLRRRLYNVLKDFTCERPTLSAIDTHF